MTNPSTNRSLTTRTTLTLPTKLLEATDQLVIQGKVKSRNEFIAKAIKNELAALKRAEIDAELAEMAQDPEYQALVLQLDAEFALASWEAFQLGEKEE
ncbi:CopG family transcriptional regulator [Aphanothece hegewaldii CCALA 016]|uniref:CopG family transcriptional regulator n=1 Tax=Aphanothece hegewaldii CCALA 016 TaxID=2107694 RepID=A0A2T1LUQ1_9CHRO|nr:ribbon-helix-helix protein, CopG family [Aphanothece hegewaldii]PSF35214.1 CopG family transcriptional regulator [Aphanothece hegewaldii CCALA 016]